MIARLVDPRVVAPGDDVLVAVRDGNVFAASYHEGGTHDVFLDACEARLDVI